MGKKRQKTYRVQEPGPETVYESQIEAWGKGIEKIETACGIADAKMPEITYKFGGVLVTFTGDVMGKGLDGGSVGRNGEAEGREETTRATRKKTREKVSEESSQKSSVKSSVK
jgi:hypothetical protein